MKKKKIFASVLCFVMLLIMTGCGNKKAITTDTFKSKSEAEGYTVTEITNQYSSVSYIEKAYLALSNDGYQVEFYVLSDESYAKSMFETNKTILENLSGTNKTETKVNIGNHSKYSVTTNSSYGYVSRIDNTLVYVNTNAVNKDNVNSLIKKLGY